jgi:hypothetical protein
MTVATAVKAGQSPLVYLKDQLQFSLGEWQSLSKEDQEWYRQAAAEEMRVLGIEVK